MNIIDFHTHTFPDKLAPHAIASLEKTSNTKAFSDGTKAGLKRSMAAAGIGTSVLLPIAVKPQQTHTINTVAIENNKEPGFVSFGSVHPYDENFACELTRLSEAGIKGIKLHPDFQEVFLDDPKTVQVMRRATDMGFLIVIHAGMDVSYPDLHRSTPQRLYRVLPQLRGAKIICAHSGGYRYLDDVENYLLDREEIYIDTSYSIGKMNREQLLRIYKAIDPTHLLFGTDSPWDDQKTAVQQFLSLDLPDSLKEAALFQNAQRLLK